MVPLDRAMKCSYRLSIITMSICSGLAAILNAKLLPAAIPTRAEFQFRIIALIVAIDIAAAS